MKIDNLNTVYTHNTAVMRKNTASQSVSSFGFARKRIKFKDSHKEILFSELHALLTSGIDFNRALMLIIQNEKNAGLKSMLQQLQQDVISGKAFWQSMSREKVFSKLDSGVIRIGEETGKISDSLYFLSDYYNKKITQRRMITSAVSYPIIILATAILVFVFMIMVIVPLFVDVYSRTGGELPGITVAVMAFSDNFMYYLLIFCLLGIGISIVFNPKQKNERLQKIRTCFLLRIPIVGQMISLNYQSNFCKLLYLLYSSGITLLHGVEMLAEIITFYPYSKSLVSIAEGIRMGGSFSGNVGKFPELYDNRLLTLLQVGEETNTLSTMLNKQGKELTSQLEYKIKQLGSIMEPLLILFIGILVATILISMYLPMFRLGTVIQ